MNEIFPYFPHSIRTRQYALVTFGQNSKLGKGALWTYTLQNLTKYLTFRAVHSGGAKGAVAPARKTKCFFSNIVSDFAGLFLVAILVRNLTKTEFAPADKKS